MKKIIIGMLIVLSAAIYGCKTEDSYQKPCTTNSCMQSSFNQETYIWENIFFPTNRTTGKQ